MKVRYRDIRVNYFPSLAGGGEAWADCFVQVVRKLFGKVEKICEFASGPGFIGFSLLANDLCEKLTLVDVNPEAVRVCLSTVEENQLGDRVSIFGSNGLDAVPETERWNLVVMNPPFEYCTRYDYEHTFAQGYYTLRIFDPEWAIHRQFYKQVGRFLFPAGSVLAAEDWKFPGLWRRMVEAAGLEFVKCFYVDRPPARFSSRFGRAVNAWEYFSKSYSKDKLHKSSDPRSYRDSLSLARRVVYDLHILGRDTVDAAWRSADHQSFYFVWSRTKEIK
jgi:methylase of polypeptide subunit release factors